MTSLTERLGFLPNDRVVIITVDDLGFSFGANSAGYDAMRTGIASSASLMVPAPWARGAAAEYRGEDIGIHLTLNSELDLYRWGPITHAPSLLDGDGGFPRTIHDIWEHADLDEVRREWRAQIERAIYWGFDTSHLDAHLGGVELKSEFFDVYLDLAEEFNLPIRLPARSEETRVGFPFRQLAEERAVLSPDYVSSLAAIGLDRASLEVGIGLLAPGLTEICVHPALDTPELRAATPDWEVRVIETDLLQKGGLVAELFAREGIEVIGYRALRNLMTAN